MAPAATNVALSLRSIAATSNRSWSKTPERLGVFNGGGPDRCARHGKPHNSHVPSMTGDIVQLL